MQGEHGESKKIAIYKLRKVHAKKYTTFSPMAEGGICGPCVNIWTPISLPASLMPCVSVCVCTQSLQSCSASGFLTTSATWEDLFMPHSLFSICFVRPVYAPFFVFHLFRFSNFIFCFFFFLTGIQLIYIVALVSTVAVLDVSLSAA